MRISYAIALALVAGSVCAQPQSPVPPTKPAPCSPVPKSWKLSKPVPFEAVDKALTGTHKGWVQYSKRRRTGDLFHEFSDARTRGYAVVRGGCLNSFFVTASK